MKSLKTYLLKLPIAFIAAAFVTTPSAFATGGGDHVGNGGGLAEKNVLYAYEKLDKYIRLCLNSEACKISASDKIILQKIQAGLPQEQSKPQIQFGSEMKRPGAFIIENQVRVARTGDTIGSPIFINVDMLYTKNEMGAIDPVTVPEAVAILLHELGHHYGRYTHEELDLMGVRVSMALQQKIISTPLLPWTSEISAQVFNPNLSSFPDLILTVGDSVVDLSKEYAATVRCTVFKIPIPILPIPDIRLVTQAPASSILHNVHWDGIKESDSTINVRIVGNVSNKCKSNEGSVRLNNSQISIEFTIQKANGKYSMNRESLRLAQFSSPWWKFIKLPGQ